MIRCFCKVERGKAGRRGIWMMTRESGTYGIFFHGDRNATEPPVYPVEELLTMVVAPGTPFAPHPMQLHVITQADVLDELKGWPFGIALAQRIFAANAEPSAEPIHEMFGLSYGQYLTLPRSVLQSMPFEWQVLFCYLIMELDNTIDWRPEVGTYQVQLRLTDEAERGDNDKYWGKVIPDPLEDYERGRRRLPLKKR